MRKHGTFWKGLAAAAALLGAGGGPLAATAAEPPMFGRFAEPADDTGFGAYNLADDDAQASSPSQEEPATVATEEDDRFGDCHDCDGDCDGCGCRRGGLLRFLRPSNHDFDCFITPVTNPVYFEDPRTLTEVRFVFIHHKLPPALGAGDVQALAMQARLALTRRLSFIAIKDGFVFAGPDAPHDDGWADVAAGLKYNLWADRASRTLLSTGMTVGIPVGTARALQGNGSGEFNLFMTGGAQLGRKSHFVSASGFRLPSDTVDQNQLWYWSNHLDTMIWRRGLYAFTECNWYHYMRSGRGGVPGIGGLDLYNLGSTGMAGNSIVTMAAGLKLKPSRHTEIGFAWEAPVTTRHDLMDNRLTIDWIFRY